MSMVKLHPWGGAPTTPLELLGSDLYAWLRSDTVTTAGSSPVYVNQFTDKTGNGRHWTRDRGYPEYKATGAPSGNPTVCVSKVVDGFGAAWSVAQTWTIVFAGKWDSSTAAAEYLMTGTSTTIRNGKYSAPDYGLPVMANIGGTIQNQVWVDNDWHVCEICGTGSSDSRVSIDNSTTVTGTLGGTLSVLEVPDNAGSPAVFEFSEVVVVSRALTTEERALLYGMMNSYLNG